MPVTINGTTGIAGVDGSAGTPAVQGSDTNTGMFFPAADTIAFAEGGAEVMRIDSSGNVGIGTSSQVERLQVVSSAADTRVKVVSELSGSSYYSGLEFARATVSGGALIETIRNTVSGGVGFGFFTTADNAAEVSGTYTERARIDSSGNFYNNCTGQTGDAPNAAGGRILEVNGNQKVRVTSNGGAAFQFYSPGGGTGSPVGTISVNSGSTTYSTSSDYRLKENVQPMTGALAKVALLKPCTYTWKSTGEASQGFIAHELQAVVSECVVGGKDAVHEDGSIKPQGIDTSFLVATLTAAIQEQQALIAALQADVAALKGAQA